MTIVRSLLQHEVSLNRALKLCGMAKKRWYYEPKRRETDVDLDMLQMIRRSGTRDRSTAPEGWPLRCPEGWAGWSTANGAPHLQEDGVGRATTHAGPQGPLDADQGGPPQRGLGDGPHTMSGAVRWIGGVSASTCWTSSPGNGSPTGSVHWPLQMSLSSRWWRRSPLPNPTARSSHSNATTAPSMRAKNSERPPPFWASISASSVPTRRSRTATWMVPRHTQARVHLAARFRKLSGGRGGHIRGIPGLQPFQTALCTQVCPAGRVPCIMGGKAEMRD